MACRGVIWKLLRISFLISLSGVLGQEILLPRRGNGFFELTAAESSCLSPDPSLYYLPVIGIVTHPGDGASGRLSNATNASNIPASYVKFVESAGARVIPLIYNEPWEVILDKLSLVNGVLFTGGWCKKGLYFETVKKIFQITLDRNDAGDHFPLFGICLGFELLSMIITKYGISPKSLQENDALSSFFRILTTSTDANGEVYISTAQAYNYPVTGFQWHPEKNAFEWGVPMIPHSEDAVRVTQHTANYFISEARKSSNRPSAREVLENLIYNYNPTYGGKAGKGYDEVYIFT